MPSRSQKGGARWRSFRKERFEEGEKSRLIYLTPLSKIHFVNCVNPVKLSEESTLERDR